MSEYEDLNIRHIKLVSGEEILALVSKVDSRRHLVLVERPLAISCITMTSKESYYLSDWMPVSKEKLTAISATHIVAQAEVTDVAKEAYVRYCLNGPSEPPDMGDEDDDELYSEEYTHIDKSKLH